MSEETTETDELKILQKLVGPKSTKTKEVEIEGHNPLTLQKLVERRKTKPVLFSDFIMTQVSPDDTSCD